MEMNGNVEKQTSINIIKTNKEAKIITHNGR